MQKKALYIGGFELPDKNAASHRVLGITRILASIDYQYIFFGLSKDSTSNTKVRNKWKFDFGFVESYERPYPSNPKAWFDYLIGINTIVKIVERENISFIIAYNYPAIALLRLLIYCKAKNIKIISDCTEWYVPNEGNLFHRIIKYLDTFLRMRLAHKLLHGNILISRYLYDYYTNNAKVLIPPVIDKTSRKWKEVKTIKNEDKINLAYVGSPGKGTKDRLDRIIDSLIQIKATVRPFSLTIIGITKSQYLEYFNDNKSPLSKEIKFLGKLDHETSIKLIKTMDFTIFIRENNLITRAGFPSKLVESISCGIPVITNPNSNVAEFFLNNNIGFLVDSSSSESLKHDLIKILNIKNSDIEVLKRNCNSFTGFDFSNYIEDFKLFLNTMYS